MSLICPHGKLEEQASFLSKFLPEGYFHLSRISPASPSLPMDMRSVPIPTLRTQT
jgi:hypothetical protein